MDNFMLFICGVSITLISVMGVLVHMVSLGYKQRTKGKLPEIAIEIPVEVNK
jgi:hypothetical protein